MASLVGINNDQVDSMTFVDLSTYTQGSVAEMTRTLNTEAP